MNNVQMQASNTQKAIHIFNINFFHQTEILKNYHLHSEGYQPGLVGNLQGVNGNSEGYQPDLVGNLQGVNGNF